MSKKNNTLLYYLVGVVLFLGIIFFMFRSDTPAEKYTYTEIVSYFQQDKVQEYSLDLNTSELTISKLDGKELKGADQIVYKVPNINMFYGDTQEHILDYNLKNPEDLIEGSVLPPKQESFLNVFLPYLVISVLFIFVLMFMMRQMGGGGGGGGLTGNFGKAKAKSGKEGRRVTFEDVAGADEEKQELQEVIEFLKQPGKFNQLGARVPKGVLLEGPPGTGKTLLARAVAGEADVEFFSISGSDFVEMYVGVGASRVRDLFDQAKKASPSVIFIDEIDAVGRQRGAGLGGGHDEREQTLNQLLVEMDGFAANIGVIIIAATNRSDILDPALLRPGRFDRRIQVNYPDVIGRADILKVHSKNKPLGPDVNLKTVARATIGFTGADLENLMNESALLAARENKKAITMEDIDEATIKVLMGPEKPNRVTHKDDKKITAYHESGHAIATYHLPTQDRLHQVTIMPRGGAAGFVLNLPTEDKAHVSKLKLEEELIVFLAGRVSEELFLSDVNTGASSDLQRASQMAREMVTKYGFSDEIGPVVYDTGSNDNVFLGRDYGNKPVMSEAVAAKIDREVHRILTEAYAKCRELLDTNRNQVELLTAYLLTHEKMDGDQFEELMTTSKVAGKPFNPNVEAVLAGEVDIEEDLSERTEETDSPTKLGI